MTMKKITANLIKQFKNHLLNEEKSDNTIEKYIRDITAFCRWLGEKNVDKIVVLEYKAYLVDNYKPASVNSVLSSINSFFVFNEWYDCRVKALKIQKQIFTTKEKELTKAEYERLLDSARSKKNERLYLLMQTICSTGIRVSELRFITAEAVKSGVAHINCKGKLRQVFLPKVLRKTLTKYLKEQKIKSGSVFVSRTGKPLDRSNIWTDMKKLCEQAGVSKDKVFPHNLRHLFARTYYSLQKDIVRLADILGHSSVNTTRIYTMESGEVHKRQIEKLGLLMCFTT
ncbi:MAG: integrase [Ruminococcaceae bacterium]|nr:integrase [Oscillospiraceae bacterium]